MSDFRKIKGIRSTPSIRTFKGNRKKFELSSIKLSRTDTEGK